MKNTAVKVISLFLLCTFLLCMCACKKKEGSKTRELYALDTIITLTAYGKNAEAALEAGAGEIRRLEALFSVNSEKSDISKINNALGSPVEVSAETSSLLNKAIEAHKLTGGRFDITTHKISLLWGFGCDEHRVPSEKEINDALQYSGIENLSVSGNSVTLKKGSSIGLGGIAKGYIGDRVAQVMKDAGCDCAVISLGGNIRTLGEKPSCEPFRIGVEHPENGGYFVTLEVSECSVITSGAYQRNFTEDGNFYHHIINPETGYPCEITLSSVTVVGSDGAMCDALSTAIFIGGEEYAKEIYSSHKEFSILLLTNDNKLIASENLRDKLSLESDYKTLSISYFS